MITRCLKLLFLSATLAGCTKAAIPTVQALSTTLVQMKTSSPSPFTQAFNTNKYAVFSGQCLTIITNLQISFNDGPWVSVPSTAASPVNGTYAINGVPYPYTEVSTPTGSYDIDCSDGTFNFWIYEHQLDELVFNSLGLLPTNSNINKVSIRGVSGSYTTEPTVFVSPFQSGPPTKIALNKASPVNGTGIGQCAELVISLRSSDDKYSNYASDIPMSLTHSKNGITDNGFVLYPNYNDCSSGTAAVQMSPTSLKISSGNSTLRVFYSPVSPSIGDNHSFAVSYANSPIALDTSHALVSFSIKSGSGT